SIMFILADVAGHSVLSSYAVAAFLAMLSTFVGECLWLMAQGAGEGERSGRLHACGLYGQIPCQPLRHLALRFNEGIQTGPFSEVPVCALLGLWNPADGSLHLLNAGIPHGLVCHHADGLTTEIALNGTPLGIFPDPALEEASLELKAGDRLLFGTDGFFDVTAAGRPLFAESAPDHWSRLKDLPIDQALSAICEQVRDHGNGIMSDDLLVIGFEQPVPERTREELVLRLPSTPKAIDMACDRLEECMKSPTLTGRVTDSRRFDICLAIREALTNAIYHGNGSRPEAIVKLHFQLDASRGLAIVSVEDEGPGFDLESHRPPKDILSERGRGIPLIRAYAQEVRMDGSRLTMTFPFEETSQ
ncbi:MAG TPA: ATP-binding SpoIIE family protein phosphatase, partial [Holophaga sp.]|nr:ATP-binding SpoIIE family protein phosphatase [Holophaga sp.]